MGEKVGEQWSGTFIRSNGYMSTYATYGLIHSINGHGLPRVRLALGIGTQQWAKSQNPHPHGTYLLPSYLHRRHRTSCKHTGREIDSPVRAHRGGLFTPVSFRKRNVNLKLESEYGILTEGLWHPLTHHRNRHKQERGKVCLLVSLSLFLVKLEINFCLHTTDLSCVSTVVRNTTLCIRIVNLKKNSCHPISQSPEGLTDVCGLPKSHVKTTV